jgi:hypothetical protein
MKPAIAIIAAIIVIAVISYFFISKGSEKSATGTGGKPATSAGEPVSPPAQPPEPVTTSDGSSGGGKLASMTCEDLLSKDFLESEFGATLSRYNETRSTNIQNEPVLSCTFEVGEEGNRRGGSATIGLGDVNEYASNLRGFQSIGGPSVAETNSIGSRSFESGPKSMPMQGQMATLYFLDSNGEYTIMVTATTFSGEEAMPHARAIAQEVNSKLSVP